MASVFMVKQFAIRITGAKLKATDLATTEEARPIPSDRACTRVFGMPELCEQIVLNVSTLKDLNNLRMFSQFNCHIYDSPSLGLFKSVKAECFTSPNDALGIHPLLIQPQLIWGASSYVPPLWSFDIGDCVRKELRMQDIKSAKGGFSFCFTNRLAKFVDRRYLPYGRRWKEEGVINQLRALGIPQNWRDFQVCRPAVRSLRMELAADARHSNVQVLFYDGENAIDEDDGMDVWNDVRAGFRALLEIVVANENGVRMGELCDAMVQCIQSKEPEWHEDRFSRPGAQWVFHWRNNELETLDRR